MTVRQPQYVHPNVIAPKLVHAVRASGLLEELGRMSREDVDRSLAEFEADPLANYSALSLNFERFWGCNASLHCRFMSNGRDRTATQIVWAFKPSVRVNWSSMHRTPAEAMSTLDLYTRVTTLAATMEGIMNSHDYIGYTEEIPAPEPVSLDAAL